MTSPAEVFKSLSDATRLRILNLLSKAKKELCVCELVDSLEVLQYNVSRHLKELEQVNLISSRKEGGYITRFIKIKASFKENCWKLFQPFQMTEFFPKT